jgi:hypothetical protein
MFITLWTLSKITALLIKHYVAVTEKKRHNVILKIRWLKLEFMIKFLVLVKNRGNI